ncbi:hypothetical protein ABZ801_12655 [Actinomadura sp. NPDC047616]|uniref:hypothetical protein n=1 Tax=Actinomadura sp. NPDC047616 TaxID=3155914 RepID=UPI0033C85DBD
MGGPANGPLGAPVAAEPATTGETVVIPAPPAPPASPAPSAPAAVDPETTSAWAFDAADVADVAEAPKTPAGGAPTVIVPAVAPADAATPSNGFVPPAAPAPAAAEPAPPEPAASAPTPSAPDAPAAWTNEAAGAQGPAEPHDPTAPESIIPESWFAQPKRPEERPDEQGQAAQAWAAQQPPPAWGMDAPPPADTAPPTAEPPGQTTVLDAGAPQPPMPHAAMPPASPAPPMQQPAPPTLMDQGMYVNQPPAPHPGAAPGNGPYYGAPYHNPADGHFSHPIQGADTAPPGFPPYPAGPHAKAKKGVSKPLLITVSGLVVAALVSVGLVVFAKDDTKSQQPVANSASPSPTKTTVTQRQTKLPATMQDQAKEVDAILVASRDTRNELKRAVGAARSCKTLPAAMAGFQNVKTRRENQLRRTQALQLDKVPNGERLRATMRQAFQASLQADQALITWGQRAQRNCRGKPRPDVGRASGRVPAERKAIIAKRRLVAIWNPIAKKAGLPHRIAANL